MDQPTNIKIKITGNPEAVKRAALASQKGIDLNTNGYEEDDYVFGDGKRPTKKPLDDYYALHQDLTMNFIGFAGRLRWKSEDDGILRVEYRDLFE